MVPPSSRATVWAALVEICGWTKMTFAPVSRDLPQPIGVGKVSPRRVKHQEGTASFWDGGKQCADRGIQLDEALVVGLLVFAKYCPMLRIKGRERVADMVAHLRHQYGIEPDMWIRHPFWMRVGMMAVIVFVIVVRHGEAFDPGPEFEDS